MRPLIALLLLALAACTPAARPTGGVARDDPGLWADPPDCVVVMPAEVDPQSGLSAREVEEALARHLSGRVERVLGPARRDAVTRRLGLDLHHPGDRARLAGLAGCRHAAVSRLHGGRAWGLVWSETRVSAEIALLGLADGRPLWRGRRVARRGDGGLPLSPLSAAVATGLAARAALDGGILPSVLDDALRAVFSDLPDFRALQPFASRNSSVSPLSSRK